MLCTYPIEHMAALTPRVNPDDTVTLYDALATHAGVRRLITVDDPRVACDTLLRDDGTLFAVLASHAAEPLTVKPSLGCGGELTARPDVSAAAAAGQAGTGREHVRQGLGEQRAPTQGTACEAYVSAMRRSRNRRSGIVRASASASR